jgi:hypothetical protein
MSSCRRPSISTAAARVDPPPALRLARAEQDVLGDREVRDQGRLLGHGGDPGGERVGGVAEGDRLAVEEDAARVRRQLAREDLQQRRLARAVLPHQAVDLVPAQLEVHRLQGLDRPVALVDSACL